MGKELNGLDLSQLQEVLEAIHAEPEKARSDRWTSRVGWLGGFKFKAFTKHHAFIVDEPAHLGGAGEGPNSVEYVLGALGTCLATGFVLNATKRGVQLNNLEVALEGQIDNILTFLGLSEEGHSGYREVVARLYVSTDADEEMIGEVWEQTLKTSPVGNTLARSVVIKPELSVIR